MGSLSSQRIQSRSVLHEDLGSPSLDNRDQGYSPPPPAPREEISSQTLKAFTGHRDGLDHCPSARNLETRMLLDVKMVTPFPKLLEALKFIRTAIYKSNIGMDKLDLSTYHSCFEFFLV
ncbi:hypothetical protein QJS10_CPA06g01850 [Acorus calamus]|uniref:Uncharacterized protein n=1 Tax=Acorus calamus TaxID=4465 RepID=A0AAV9EMA1_ACOCL|nr:hypothetical protein QJS10_CPA06g01850 [Acorus calamus]